jgi:hypothetical protein
MRFIVRVFSRLLLVNVVMLGLVAATRFLPVPHQLERVGIGRCGGRPCALRSANVVDFNNTWTTLAWVVAWFGAPCASKAYNGSVILTFENVEVYARSAGWSRDIFLADDELWAMEVVRNEAGGCRFRGDPWRGFNTTTSISAGAFSPR